MLACPLSRRISSIARLLASNQSFWVHKQVKEITRFKSTTPKENTMATRWGICGSGKISSDFCRSVQHLPETEHKVVAIAASEKAKADAFAAEFNIPQTFGSYDEMGKAADVDVVYVGVIHTRHVEMCLKYIEAGKNVVCEKPMALTLEGCRRVLKSAKDKGVFFLEATWSRFFPLYEEIRQQVASGNLGEVKAIQANFCAPIASVPRIDRLDMGGGALMDIGLYTIQAASMIFKGMPEKVTAVANKAESGADLTGSISLLYSGGRLATLTYSAEVGFQDNYLVIRGTKGTIKVPDLFWCPTQLVLSNGEEKVFALPDVKNKEKYNFSNSQGLMYEAMATRDCLQKGLKETKQMSHEDSETIMCILDQCLTQLGITYQHP